MNTHTKCPFNYLKAIGKEYAAKTFSRAHYIEIEKDLVGKRYLPQVDFLIIYNYIVLIFMIRAGVLGVTHSK